MARRGENIYKRKDGRWEGRYISGHHPDGKARYGYVYGRTYAEVKSRRLERQTVPWLNTGRSKKSGTDFGEYLDRWLKSTQIRVKPSTYALYYQLIERHIRPALGGLDVCGINAATVERYVRRLLEAGRLDGKGGLSPKTVMDILSVIKRVLSYAKNQGLDVACDLSGICVRRNTREMRVLSSAEQEKLTAHLLADMDLSKFGVFVCLYTGLRIGEVCALKWKNIHMDSGILEVRNTMERIRTPLGARKTEIIVAEPKSRCSVRDIPMPEKLITLARAFVAAPDAYVLTGEPNSFVEPRTLQNRFRRYIGECNIPPANFHSLRHTFATRCVELGFEIKSLSEILGHSNVNITLNRYVHSSIELKRSNMKKLEASMA